MNLLNRLTTKNLKLNKKRTVVTIIGIILSVALLTAVASMFSSILQSTINYEIELRGNYHVGYYDVPISELDTFRSDGDITEMSLTQDLGYAEIETKNEYKPYAFVKAYTPDALNNITSRLVEGRLPENENEIIIPTHLKTNGRNLLKVGDTVTLNVGERVNDAGEVFTQSDPYDANNSEKITSTTGKTYTVVGVVERPSPNIEPYDVPGYTFVTYVDENKLTGNVDVYLRYNKKAAKGLAAQVENSKYEYGFNEYLMMLEANPFQEFGDYAVVILLIMGIIVITSVFCIKNSFDISITERIKQYGMIRSIGATKKQIRRNVFYEATVLGAIGIPLGVLSGWLATVILVVGINYFMNEDGDALGSVKLMFSVSPVAILIAIIFGIVTIYLSALRSAVKASKVSPIDSIRNSAEIKIKSKKVRSPKIIKKLFGIGGEISYKNLKRNKKKYRTTVISIVMSVFIFIALSSFMGSMLASVGDELKGSDYNVYLSSTTYGNENRYNKFLKTTKLAGVDDYTVYRTIGYGDNVCAIGDEQYRKYIKKLGLNYEDIKDKIIAVNCGQVGDVVKSENFDGTLEIGYVTDERPFGLDYPGGEYHVISDELFESLLTDEAEKSLTIYYHATDADKLQDEIDQILITETHYFMRNLEESARQHRNLVTLMGVFLYGFIIVLSLIGVTNIFNTITTNMELRKPEFAMLRSVGMTSKEFNRMIRLETVFMGTRSLFFGTILGVAASYLLYYAGVKGAGASYSFPIIPVVIAILAVFLLISLIMNYSIAKISKQNTIETIRNENI